MQTEDEPHISGNPEGRMSKPDLTIVIPIHNEEGNIGRLIDEIMAARGSFSCELAELLVIDDGSTDASVEEVRAAMDVHRDVAIRCLRLRRRFGKSTALSLGFRRAVGTYICTIDGDCQDVPSELPKLIEKLEEGYDAVSGWKKDRQDPLSKRLPSKFFNFILRTVWNVPMHDFNCGFKLYRAHAVRRFKVYGDLYRFIPLFLAELGFRVAEVPVSHRARTAGSSKYNAKRLFTGVLDFFSVLILTRFLHKPGHFFGGVGLAVGVVGTVVLTYLGVLWCLDMGPIGTRPLFFLGVLCELLAVQFILFGVLAELITRFLIRLQPDARLAEVLDQGA